jgi:hypothetical protein
MVASETRQRHPRLRGAVAGKAHHRRRRRHPPASSVFSALLRLATIASQRIQLKRAAYNTHRVSVIFDER